MKPEVIKRDQERVDQESQENHALNRNADDARHRRVLRRRLHLVAERGPVEKRGQAEDGKDGEGEDADALQRHGMAEDGDVAGRYDRGEG